jgi:hypothetical protein
MSARERAPAGRFGRAVLVLGVLTLLGAFAVPWQYRHVDLVIDGPRDAMEPGWHWVAPLLSDRLTLAVVLLDLATVIVAIVAVRASRLPTVLAVPMCVLAVLLGALLAVTAGLGYGLTHGEQVNVGRIGAYTPLWAFGPVAVVAGGVLVAVGALFAPRRARRKASKGTRKGAGKGAKRSRRSPVRSERD